MIADTETDLYIHASVGLSLGSRECSGSSLVQHNHTNLVFLESDGDRYYLQTLSGESRSLNPSIEELKRTSFHDMLRALEFLPSSVLALLRKTIKMNSYAGEIGIDKPHGLGIGFHESTARSEMGLLNSMTSLAAAGSDARMSGDSVEVMSSAGSGNQGIVATVPVVLYCEYNAIEEDRLLRALALSHLVTMYVTVHIGALSALCGAGIKSWYRCGLRAYLRHGRRGG